ncbi:hypothetical protein [Asticcacaulis benevestitus]|uniref:hypothetical protein n=1 Tax=Asticcacaulis benevestitus TaxID=347481 RepID=UPI000377BEAE|nr:hypothetical protein [Asticcacaulis benevestitus]
MVPEYKFFHGAVLCDLIDISTAPITIDELKEDGRLTSYTLNGKVGLQIKHSSARLSPWSFSFTSSNWEELVQLSRKFRKRVFVCFVCNDAGIVTLDIESTLNLLTSGQSDQAWIRITRRPGKWFEVTGSSGEDAIKRPSGIVQIIDSLT